MGTVVSESSNRTHLQTVHLLTYQRTSKTEKMLFIVTVLMPLALAQACPEVTMPECNDGEFPCWGGLDADGCPIPDYCIPEKTGEIGTDGNECWSMCSPSCNQNETCCDMGYYNGCWSGGYCTMGWGDCPAICSTPCAYEDGEQWCDNGTDGTECHNVCSSPCSMNGTLCDNGYDNGCWMGNHCVEPWGECQAICYVPCDYDAGEKSCDMGMDENDCWMGNYCAAECPDNSSVAP